ncbi:Protein of unknown function [Gryllus bimaculatus]|nr:Protein of unknown function [Gryllus bimaculatus]
MILLSVEGSESIYDSDKTTEITPSVLILDEEASISFPLEGEHENENASAPNEESPPKVYTSYVIAEWHNPSQNEMGSKRMSGKSSQNEVNGPFEMLVETKLEVANTQKKLAEDEIQHKKEMHELEKKNKMEMHELEKKMEMHKLEKEELRKVQEKNK